MWQRHEARPIIISSNSTATVPPGSLKIKIPASWCSRTWEPQWRYVVHIARFGSSYFVEIAPAQVPKNSTLKAMSTTYAVKQSHFYTPSEHRVDGLQYVMEMYFVVQPRKHSQSCIDYSSALHSIDSVLSIERHRRAGILLRAPGKSEHPCGRNPRSSCLGYPYSW